MEIKGTYTAIITPFRGEEVDYDGLRQNLRRQIAAGVDGIVALGTTAETPTLSEQEQAKIIVMCREECAGKINLIVGTGSNSTAHTIHNTKIAKELGADAVLIVTPYYNKPTQEGIFRHFKAVCDAVDIPVIVYNIQGRSGVNIETATLQRIAQLENVVAVKEASGNIGQMGDVLEGIARVRPGFCVMSGDDALTMPLMALGGRGVISVVSNLVPERVVEMVNVCLEGDFTRARELHFGLLPIFRGAFIETNPVPIKEAMAMCGMPSGQCRLPLCEMSQEHRQKLQKILAGMSLVKQVSAPLAAGR